MGRLLDFFKQRASLRSGVIAAVAFACVAVAALSAEELWNSRTGDVKTSHRETANLAHTFAQQATDSFRAIDNDLLDLQELVQTEGTERSHLPRLQFIMAKRIAGIPLLHNLFLVDEHGNGVVNARGIKNANYAKRPWFIFHRTHADGGTHIGHVVKSLTDGSYIITASRRIKHKDGSFAGAMLATVQVSYFQELYDAVNLGKTGILTIALADGTILVRSPYDPANTGRSLAKADWYVNALPHHPVGDADSRSIIDGTIRYFAYHSVSGYPLIILVGIGQQEALEGWRFQAVLNVAQVACVLLVLLFLGKYLLVQIGKREAAEKELGALATIDDLTRLGNRRGLDEWMDREWRRAIRSHTSFACLMIDVDYFKAYNDNRGHKAGDGVLQAIAQQIAANIRRPSDLAVRYGGDEFIVLLADTDAFGAKQVAEKIRASVAAAAIDHDGNPHGIVTLSIGVASSRPNLGADSDAIVEAADAALYEAKRYGRNRTVVGDPVLTPFGPARPDELAMLKRR
jgi:diguanylate cyclase (GGDEF)-like protein